MRSILVVTLCDKSSAVHFSLIPMQVAGQMACQLLQIQIVTSAARKLAAPIKFHHMTTIKAVASCIKVTQSHPSLSIA